VAEFSAGTCLASEQCARLRSIRTAERSCFDGKKKGSYRRSLSGMTYEPSTASLGVERWISSLPGSRVSRSVSPENGKAKRTNGTYGLKRSDAFREWRSWKTFQGSLLTGTSERYSATWPRAGLMHDGTAYHQRPLADISVVTACGSLPRVPRPVACDGKGSGRIRHERSQGMNLRDWWNANYGFVYPPVRVSEYLMGVPEGWTALEPLATDKFRRWLELHGKC
jgi:hypothetical protein